MKKYIYTAFFALAAVCLASCKDFLDQASESAFDDKETFSNEANAQQVVFGIYEAINDQAFAGRLWPFKALNTDSEYAFSSQSYISSGSVNSQTSTAVYNHGRNDDYWGTAYAGAYSAIERANLCIAGLRQYADPRPGTQFGYLLGEALFLRAFVYYEMINYFGNISARFGPTDMNTIYVPRSDRDVIYKQLLADLEEAAAMMPWAGGNDATQTVLRPGRGAAKALRARIALTAGGYATHRYGQAQTPSLSNDPELSVEKTYTIARDECAELIANETSGGYLLEPMFETMFKDNCQVKVNAGGEPMFKLPFIFNHRGNCLVAQGSRHWGSNGNNPKSGSDPYTTNYTGGFMALIPTMMYEFGAEDTRREVSVVPFEWYDGVQRMTAAAGVLRTTSGKLRAEWLTSKLTTNANDGITPIVIRYADVLLMFAEAENKLNGGPTDAAKQALNRVRTRAYGGVDQTAWVTAVSGSEQDFFNAIVDERRLEFLGETIRKADLIRWNLLKTKMDAAKADMGNLMNLTGKYADVPAYTFYRVKDNKFEMYGFTRTEHAPGITGKEITDRIALNAWMADNGWQMSNNAAWVNISTANLECFYYADPDKHQIVPIPESAITNSLGTLSNDELGYF